MSDTPLSYFVIPRPLPRDPTSPRLDPHSLTINDALMPERRRASCLLERAQQRDHLLSEGVCPCRVWFLVIGERMQCFLPSPSTTMYYSMSQTISTQALWSTLERKHSGKVSSSQEKHSQSLGTKVEGCCATCMFIPAFPRINTGSTCVDCCMSSLLSMTMGRLGRYKPPQQHFRRSFRFCQPSFAQ